MADKTEPEKETHFEFLKRKFDDEIKDVQSYQEGQKRKNMKQVSILVKIRENRVTTDPRRKMLIASLFTAICLFVPACFYLIRAANVNKWDTELRAQLADADVDADEIDHIYDIYPMRSCQNFHDPDLNASLKTSIQAECEQRCIEETPVLSKRDQCNIECLSEGTNWSLLFMVHGITLLLMSFAFLLIAIGSRVFLARIVGVCLNWWLGCAHIAGLVLTALYRFNDKGRLALNCLDASEYRGEGEALADSWTFRMDGQLISTLWLLQLLAAFFLCCFGSNALDYKKYREMPGYKRQETKEMKFSVSARKSELNQNSERQSLTTPTQGEKLAEGEENSNIEMAQTKQKT